MRPTIQHFRWLAVAALIFLSACSNGRGSVQEASTPPVAGDPTQPLPPPPPEPPPAPPPEPPPVPAPSTDSALAGYWQGSVIEKGDDDDDDEGARDATAFVDQLGDTHLLVSDEQADDFVVYGNVCCDTRIDDKFAGASYLGTRAEKADFGAELSSGSLAGDFEFRGRDYRFSLAPSSAYIQPLTLQDLAGVYTRTTPQIFGAPLTLTLAINADGLITGSHSNGCLFEGSATIADTLRNMVRFNMNVDNCGTELSSSPRWNGEYTGLGVLLRNAPVTGNAGTRENTLLLSLVGPTWLGLLSVEK